MSQNLKVVNAHFKKISTEFITFERKKQNYDNNIY